MAAKKQTPGRGQKQCPHCKKIVGARKAVCDCGHDFKSAKAASARTRPAPGKLDVAAMMGTVRQLAEFIDECGGYEEALEWLDATEQLVNTTGSFAALREALEVASEIRGG